MAITTGYRDITMLVVPEDNNTWADLGSSPLATWADWTTWVTDPTDIVVEFTDDIGFISYRTPLLSIEADGDATFELDISTTGAFTGEESNIPFSTGVEYDYPQGRYFRWTITISANVDNPVPLLRTFSSRYSAEYETEYLDDYEVYANTSTGITPALPTSLGVIKHIQATTHQGPPYVESGYVIETQGSEYVRTAVPTTASNITLTPGTPFSLTATALNFGSQQGYIIIDSIGANLLTAQSAGAVTIESWAYVTTLDTASDIVQMVNPFITPRTEEFAMGVRNDGVNFVWGVTSGYTLTGTTTIQTDTWYHVAFTWDGTTSKLWVNGVLEDSTTTSPGWSIIDNAVMGGQETPVFPGSPVYAPNFYGEMSNFRISDSVRYTANFTTPTGDFYNDTDTLFLLRHTTSDENGEDYGTDTYIIEQRGGVAQIETKNPPTLQIVDYTGSPWDGTVDVMLVGLRKITRVDQQVVIV